MTREAAAAWDELWKSRERLDRETEQTAIDRLGDRFAKMILENHRSRDAIIRAIERALNTEIIPALFKKGAVGRENLYSSVRRSVRRNIPKALEVLNERDDDLLARVERLKQLEAQEVRFWREHSIDFPHASFETNAQV